MCFSFSIAYIQTFLTKMRSYCTYFIIELIHLIYHILIALWHSHVCIYTMIHLNNSLKLDIKIFPITHHYKTTVASIILSNI